MFYRTIGKEEGRTQEAKQQTGKYMIWKLSPLTVLLL